MTAYLLIKSLHLLFVIAWMARCSTCRASW